MASGKRVFVSYDYDNDRHYKTLLLAWAANQNVDFSIYDHSADVSINSTNANAIKSVLSRYINEAPHFLVLIGQRTYRSAWVNWEIEKAKELRKHIVAVKIERSNTSPQSLLNSGADWAHSFTFASIVAALG